MTNLNIMVCILTALPYRYNNTSFFVVSWGFQINLQRLSDLEKFSTENQKFSVENFWRTPASKAEMLKETRRTSEQGFDLVII